MAKKRNLKTPLVMSLFLLAIVSTAGAEIIYVDTDASTGGDGQTWGTAYKYLQDGLSAAVSDDEVWVAEGSYKPDQGGGQTPNDRTATFQLLSGVAIYGGFAGGETSLGQRDWQTSKTILSGDIGTVGNNSDNSYQVVTGSGTNETAILEGFIITAGNANGSNPYDRGGGMYNYSSRPTVTNCTFSGNSAYDGGGMDNHSSSPTVTNCTFSGNSAQFGGGMCNRSSSPTVINCTFSDNSTFGSATSKGGGMYNEGKSNPSVTNCTFSGNSARWGGGMANWDGSPTLTNCTFRGNSVGRYGGGMWNRSNSSRPMLTNCTFGGNSATYGGGISNEAGSSPTVKNCTFSGNSASQYGGGVENYENSSATLTNCIFWANSAPGGPQIYNSGGGSATVSYSDVQGGWPGTGNINENPLFVDSATGDYHLKSQAGRWDSNSQSWVKDDVTSPCIDGGDPDSDWRAELWPHGTRTNMGAYGGTPQASMSLSDVGNIADLNADNAVHFADFANFAGHWHAEEALIPQDLDRDGIVGPNDLAILSDNWLAEVKKASPLPLAHWKLDETEGIFAHDSAGDKDGTLHGGPLWQPAAGKIDGALQLDGIDDYVSTDFPLNPADLSFSIFAWVKGGTPGQVILSQLDLRIGRTAYLGSTWLGTDSSDGRLITALMEQTFGPLESEFVITDGQWHNVGLVYDFDGFCRRLYVDGVEVAKDETVVAGLPSGGSLRFGADKDLSTGSFFSGLIDDVQIYNVALSAKEIEELER